MFICKRLDQYLYHLSEVCKVDYYYDKQVQNVYHRYLMILCVWTEEKLNLRSARMTMRLNASVKKVRNQLIRMQITLFSLDFVIRTYAMAQCPSSFRPAGVNFSFLDDLSAITTGLLGGGGGGWRSVLYIHVSISEYIGRLYGASLRHWVSSLFNWIIPSKGDIIVYWAHTHKAMFDAEYFNEIRTLEIHLII